MSRLDYLNVYVIEGKLEIMFGTGFFVLVVAAENRDLAISHVKEKIGIEGTVTNIMAKYPKIWSSDGSVLANQQVKILYNGSHWSK